MPLYTLVLSLYDTVLDTASAALEKVCGHVVLVRPAVAQLPVAVLLSKFWHAAPVVMSMDAGHVTEVRPATAQLPVAVPLSEFLHEPAPVASQTQLPVPSCQ